MSVSVGSDTLQQVLGPGLIQKAILQCLRNTCSLKEVQAWVSLHALGFLKTEDLKKHFCGENDPYRRPIFAEEEGDAVKMCIQNLRNRIQSVTHKLDTDVSMLLGTLTTREEVLRHFKYFKYVPWSVYSIVRTGISAQKQLVEFSKRISAEGGSIVGADMHALQRETMRSEYDVDLLAGACQAGLDVEVIDRIIHEYQWPCDKHPLHEAAANGHLEIVTFLLEKSTIDPDDRDDEWNTPFMYACWRRHIDIMKYLIKSDRVAIHTPDEFGKTPFMHACFSGNMDVVRFFVELGEAELNYYEDDNGCKALMHACSGGHVDVVRHLLEQCTVNIEDWDDDGRTAFMYACRDGRVNVVKYLLDTQQCSVHKKDLEGRTGFMLACLRGRVEVVKCLVETVQIDMNQTDFEGRTGLMIACLDGHIDVVKYLVDTVEVDLKIKDQDGNTACRLAVLGRYANLARLLAEAAHTVLDDETALMMLDPDMREYYESFL